MSNSYSGNTWYTYDALDRRVAAGFTPYWPEYYPGLPTAIGYHHDGPEVAVEYQTADWTTLTAWDVVNGPGLDEPVMRTDGTSRFFYHADALGSVVALTDNTGAVAEQYRYDAWGHMAARDGAGNGIVPGTVTGNLTTFTGREYDPIAGLYYYRARYYHPGMGRFISRDPIGEAGGVNLYAYCGNDPVNFWDPWGLDVWVINDRDAAGGHGHAGALVGQRDGKISYRSFGPEKSGAAAGKGKVDSREFDSLDAAMKFAKEEGYDRFNRFDTCEERDRAALDAADQWKDDQYNVGSHNCQDMVNSMLDGAGVDRVGPSSHPNQNFNANRWNADESGAIH